jgi:flagellar motor switch protein FliN/FliY
MTTETDENLPEDEAAAPPTQEGNESPAENTAEADGEQDVEVNSPDYQTLEETASPNPAGDLHRLQNIQIAVTAELGRAQLPIEGLLQLNEGSVVELDREIDAPIELKAQGVTLATGEVVVVDGCFAIRVLSVQNSN